LCSDFLDMIPFFPGTSQEPASAPAGF
jgi:hypothetical protein